MNFTRIFRATAFCSRSFRFQERKAVPIVAEGTSDEETLSRIDFILGFSKQGMIFWRSFVNVFF